MASPLQLFPNRRNDVPSLAITLWLVLAAATQTDPLSPPPHGRDADTPASPIVAGPKAPTSPTVGKPSEPKSPKLAASPSATKTATPVPAEKSTKSPPKIEETRATAIPPEEEVIAESPAKIRARKRGARRVAIPDRTDRVDHYDRDDPADRKNAWSADRYAAVVPPGLTLAALRNQLAKGPQLPSDNASPSVRARSHRPDRGYRQSPRGLAPGNRAIGSPAEGGRKLQYRRRQHAHRRAAASVDVAPGVGAARSHQRADRFRIQGDERDEARASRGGHHATRSCFGGGDPAQDEGRRRWRSARPYQAGVGGRSGHRNRDPETNLRQGQEGTAEVSTQRATTNFHVGDHGAAALANARARAGSRAEHGNIDTRSARFAQVLGEITNEQHTLTTNDHLTTSTGTEQKPVASHLLSQEDSHAEERAAPDHPVAKNAPTHNDPDRDGKQAAAVSRMLEPAKQAEIQPPPTQRLAAAHEAREERADGDTPRIHGDTKNEPDPVRVSAEPPSHEAPVATAGASARDTIRATVSADARSIPSAPVLENKADLTALSSATSHDAPPAKNPPTAGAEARDTAADQKNGPDNHLGPTSRADAPVSRPGASPAPNETAHSRAETPESAHARPELESRAQSHEAPARVEGDHAPSSPVGNALPVTPATAPQLPEHTRTTTVPHIATDSRTHDTQDARSKVTVAAPRPTYLPPRQEPQAPQSARSSARPLHNDDNLPQTPGDTPNPHGTTRPSLETAAYDPAAAATHETRPGAQLAHTSRDNFHPAKAASAGSPWWNSDRAARSGFGPDARSSEAPNTRGIQASGDAADGPESTRAATRRLSPRAASPEMPTAKSPEPEGPPQSASTLREQSGPLGDAQRTQQPQSKRPMATSAPVVKAHETELFIPGASPGMRQPGSAKPLPRTEASPESHHADPSSQKDHPAPIGEKQPQNVARPTPATGAKSNPIVIPMSTPPRSAATQSPMNVTPRASDTRQAPAPSSASVPTPALHTASGPAPAHDTAPGPAPAHETASVPAPAQGTAAAPAPAHGTTPVKAPEHGTASVPAPAHETASVPTPAHGTASVPAPAPETASAAAPAPARRQPRQHQRPSSTITGSAEGASPVRAASTLSRADR